MTITEEPAMAADPASQDLLHAYLAGLDRGALVGLLVRAAAEDGRLDERLRGAAVREALRAGRTDPAGDLAGLARVVTAALEPIGRLDQDGARRYAEQVQGAVALLRRALESGVSRGGGEGLVPLVQAAVERFAEAAAAAEDPSGVLRGSASALAELHLAVCAQAGVDPVELADWLAEQHLRQGPDGPPADLDAYAGLLGDTGLAAYGATLAAAWERGGDSGRPVPARRMEQLHALRGDTDALVAVLATDLGHPSRHLRIAELLAAEGRVPEAVAWAEKGLDAAPEQRTHDAPLVVFLSAHYGAVGRRDDAVALHRDQFLRRPDPTAYRALLDAAEPGQRAAQRAWALDELGRRAARTTARDWENPAGPLIEVLVAEGELDAAWSAAVRYRAPHRARLRLAELRAATHPADAVPVYRQELDEQIGAMTRESYRAAVGWVLRLRELYRRSGRPEEFDALLAEIRDTHRAKGNLIADLAAEGL
jgi:tetratricopeptide (TPR) repeat protein